MKKINKKLLSLFFTFMLCSISTALALAGFDENTCPNEALPVSNNQLVRVGISNTSFSTYAHKSIDLISSGGLSLRDKDTHKEIYVIPAETALKISIEDKKLKAQYLPKKSNKNVDIFLDSEIKGLTVVPLNGFTKVMNVKRAGTDAVYRGVFEIIQNNKNPETFFLVNVLGLENYLRGVVPNEMPVSFGSEALKAQSIAARNYVLKPRLKYYDEYDICDSVSCQVYYGAGTENPISDIAVAQTEGNVATYDGELILAQYSSTAGGYTENYENAFSSQKDKCFGCKDNAIPYLKGVPDIKTTPVLDNETAAKDFYMNTPNSFDIDSPFYRWQKEWTEKN